MWTVGQTLGDGVSHMGGVLCGCRHDAQVEHRLTPTVQKCRWWKEHLSCATQFLTNWQCFHSGHRPRRSLAPGRDGLRHPVPPAYHLNLQGGRNEDNLSFEGKTKHIQTQIEQVWKINLDGKVTRCNNSRKLHIYLIWSFYDFFRQKLNHLICFQTIKLSFSIVTCNNSMLICWVLNLGFNEASYRPNQFSQKTGLWTENKTMESFTNC